jgi:hypothetical protein
MALQAVGYAWLLWTLWDEREPAILLPLGTIAGLLLVLHRRLLRVVTAFLSVVATLSRRRIRYLPRVALDGTSVVDLRSSGGYETNSARRTASVRERTPSLA